MAVLLVALATILLLGGFGFAMHMLWWLALTALILWLVAFIAQGPSPHRTRARWRRW